MNKFVTNSEKETRDLAKKLANKLQGVIALSGELGAGKTTLVQGFAKGLGIKDRIISPTFVFVRQHPIPKSKKIFYHIDLYRIDHNFSQLGLKEILKNTDNIVVIEWAEKLKNLPKGTTRILIRKQEGDKRLIILS